MSYNARLKRMKKAYEGSRKTAEEMFEDFPIGVYIMKLKGTELGERADESLYIMAKYVVTSAEELGRQYTNFQNINEEHLEFVHRFFMDHGIEPPDIEDIEDALQKLSESGISVKMRVFRNAGGYINGKIVSVVESDITESKAEGEPELESESKGATKEDLLNLCEIHDINIPAKVQKKDIDEIISFINDNYDVDASDIPDKDAAILEAFGVELQNTKLDKAKTKAKTKTNDGIDHLKKVCADNGIDFEKDDTAEQIGERLSDGYKWSASKDGLTDEQVDAMKNVDITVKK